MISIIIPHYKERERLFTNLKHNLSFLKEFEIVVVNDYPSIPIKEEMEQLFPGVIVIENRKNLGFAGAVHEGISAAKNTYIFLLNDDVVLNNNTFQKALSHFEIDKTLFAVSFRQTEKNGSYVGRNTIYWKNGFFQHSKADATQNGINGWAEGGSMLLDKKKYNMLGGFDPLYSPFYWEDIDLSYRAWKAGYTILFDSNVTVEHHHESTIKSNFSTSYIKTIAYRNQLITIWKNISDGKMIGEHLIAIAKNLITFPFKGEGEFVRGFGMALLLFPQIMKKRSQQKKLWKKSDKEIFKNINTYE